MDADLDLHQGEGLKLPGTARPSFQAPRLGVEKLTDQIGFAARSAQTCQWPLRIDTSPGPDAANSWEFFALNGTKITLRRSHCASGGIFIVTNSGGLAARRALVVEDEPLIRFGAVDLCEQAGLLVTEAADADQALRELSSGHAYLLLHTDIDMPGRIDGIALAWRAREINPSIAVIVVSGKVIAPQNSLPPGARFFSKPVQESDIAKAINELVPS